MLCACFQIAGFIWDSRIGCQYRVVALLLFGELNTYAELDGTVTALKQIMAQFFSTTEFTPVASMVNDEGFLD